MKLVIYMVNGLGIDTYSVSPDDIKYEGDFENVIQDFICAVRSDKFVLIPGTYHFINTDYVCDIEVLLDE